MQTTTDIENKGILQKALDGTLLPADVDKSVTNSLLFKLRKAMRISPSGQKSRSVCVLDSLGDTQLLQLWARLRIAKERGKPAYEFLAAMIQQDWGALTEMTVWNLSRAIMGFEQRVFGLLGELEVLPELREWAAEKRKIAEKIVEKVDGLAHLSEAIEMQSARIKMAYEMEMKTQFLTPYKDREFKALAQLIDTYLKYCIELGVFARQPIKFDVNLVRKGLDVQLKRIDVTVGRELMREASERFLDTLKTPEGAFEVLSSAELGEASNE